MLPGTSSQSYFDEICKYLTPKELTTSGKRTAGNDVLQLMKDLTSEEVHLRSFSLEERIDALLQISFSRSPSNKNPSIDRNSDISKPQDNLIEILQESLKTKERDLLKLESLVHNLESAIKNKEDKPSSINPGHNCPSLPVSMRPEEDSQVSFNTIKSLLKELATLREQVKTLKETLISHNIVPSSTEDPIDEDLRRTLLFNSEST
jgi:hypothetical protein